MQPSWISREAHILWFAEGFHLAAAFPFIIEEKVLYFTGRDEGDGKQLANCHVIYSVICYCLSTEPEDWKWIALSLCAFFLKSKVQNLKLFKGRSCSTNFDCFSLACCYGHSVSLLMMGRQSCDTARGWPLQSQSTENVLHHWKSLNWIPKECFQILQPTTPCSSPCKRVIA